MQPRPSQRPAVNPKSQLLGLPPELRNSIYKHLVSSDMVLDVRHGHAVSPAANLATACRQLREEILPISQHYATHQAVQFKAGVKEFCFKELTAFFDTLSPLTDGVERELAVTLSFREPGLAHVRDLAQWLDDCAHNDTKQTCARKYFTTFGFLEHDMRAAVIFRDTVYRLRTRHGGHYTAICVSLWPPIRDYMFTGRYVEGSE